jgi:hypothetical protein
VSGFEPTPGSSSGSDGPREPVIVDAAVGAGHDGRAELVVEVAYPGGGRSRLSLAPEVSEAAITAAGVDRLDALVGRSWKVLMGGHLGVSRLTRGESR